MQVDTARLLISTGAVRGVVVKPFMGKWVIDFQLGPGVPADVTPTLEGSRGKPRTWSDLARLAAALQDLGLSECTVHLQ